MGTKKGKKAKPKKHIVVYSKKGVKFCGTFESGKVKVTEERTAPGQIIGVGMLDLKTKEWSERASVPIEVKQKIETIALGKQI